MKATRCTWAKHPLELEYHDTEWGVPVHDDPTQFEFLTLESAQAGLSWLTILKRRQGYRSAFAGFDPQVVAGFDQGMIEELLQDKRIIRNRRKIEATVKNARAFLDIQEQFGSFCAYIWGFVNGTPIQNTWTSLEDLPSSTPLSKTIAKDLKQRGFSFLGPTTVYAHMQASGLINDHLVSCFRHEEIKAMA